MALLGDVLLEITGAERINYGLLGNSEPALHAHVFPRYADEPEDPRRGPAFSYDWKRAELRPGARRASYARDLRPSLLASRLTASNGRY
ncbi:hypothetical protein BH20ACT11_BH20ACT11_10030 [soil metagenome]|jgi:diadenosine tetraphosphate (Ap4A) HIT family hydrolase